LNFPILRRVALCALCVAAASTAFAQEKVIRFGHLNNTDHAVSFGTKKFAELMAAKSGGKIKVLEFPSSQLGSDMQQQSALQGGTQQMSAPSTISLAGIVKEYGLLDFPYAVTTFPQADALLDGPLGQALSARLPEKGLVSLGYWDLGFRNVTNSKRPIAKLEDFDGLKIRVIGNPVFIETFKAFKANPLPLAFAEVYGAMESKAIDGHENPYSVILSNKFYEVQKYVSSTNHVYAANIVLVSKKFWDTLSPTEQKWMHEAADEARIYQRKVAREAAQSALRELQAKGMVFTDVAPAELARMRAAVAPVIEKFSASYDPAMVKLYTDELARIHK
jgi:tripartite ATP-independent transporter DctP family solute receptor